jgi:hypothetical protein
MSRSFFSATLAESQPEAPQNSDSGSSHFAFAVAVEDGTPSNALPLGETDAVGREELVAVLLLGAGLEQAAIERSVTTKIGTIRVG